MDGHRTISFAKAKYYVSDQNSARRSRKLLNEKLVLISHHLQMMKQFAGL